MTAQSIDRSEWSYYCDRLSRVLEAKDAEIEVSSLNLGAQTEADWLPLIGISYDPNDDVFDVALEGLDHIINQPRELRVEGAGADVRGLEIRDKDGNQH